MLRRIYRSGLGVVGRVKSPFTCTTRLFSPIHRTSPCLLGSRPTSALFAAHDYSAYPKYCQFKGRIVIVGYGSIGQGALPLLLRHIGGITPDRIKIITGDEVGKDVAASYGVHFETKPITRDNLEAVLGPWLGPGDFCLNVSVDVSTVEMVKFCQARNVLYLDTVVEPWAGAYTDPSLPMEQKTNYAQREEALALRTPMTSTAATAVLTHGANPGLVSHFTKQALLNLSGPGTPEPQTRDAWAALAQKLDVRVIHIAERDTQVSTQRKKINEFVNTWSVEGFISEGCQPAELGWGTHEKTFPLDGRAYNFGRKSSIWLNRPGCTQKVRTWTPKAGHIHGFLITHAESISMSDYFTVKVGEKVVYRPTVHYAYHPCDDAVNSLHEFTGKNFVHQAKKRILKDEISPGGMDELGVLIGRGTGQAYWYGSQLSVDEARKLCPDNQATSLQVTVACLSGMVWAIQNPKQGIVEPEEICHKRILELARPYLGSLVGAYTDWNPLQDRETLFPEDIDRSDPWQFKNVRVL